MPLRIASLLAIAAVLSTAPLANAQCPPFRARGESRVSENAPGRGAPRVVQQWSSWAARFDGAVLTFTTPDTPEGRSVRLTIARTTGSPQSGELRLSYERATADDPKLALALSGRLSKEQGRGQLPSVVLRFDD